MIYTLTTNPAIDMNICTNGLEAKKVNRTFGAVYTPNGKGLNVSFVLGHFGVPSTIMGFFGGFSGKYIVDESTDRGFRVKPVWVDDTTRVNIFLNDGKTEYKLVNEGAFVTEENQRALLTAIEENEDMDQLSISGSLPKGVEPEFYDKVLTICQKKAVDVILDISSQKLADLLKYNPLLIKPNDEELQSIFGIKIDSEDDIVKALEMLYAKGAQNILLTLGEKGSYFYNGKIIYFASAQPIKLLSSACAGDSALAAFLSVWLEKPLEIEEALKNSAATGANVAESNAIGTLEKVEEYKKNIQIRKVK
ncbi:MAG: 1-phosphofructokinase [Hespellia sp.]|nr:1-phosphofructokinase [Hespellia sp.]